jgi:hypothetical protein
MGAVLNRASKQYIEFVNTPDYDPSIWVIDPDLTAVAGIAPMFWMINSDDTIGQMTASQIDTVYLSTAIETVCDQVSAKCTSILYGGFTYNGTKYDSDTQSIANLTGTQTLINAGVTLPSNFTWRDANNVNHPYTNATFTDLFACSAMWLEAVYLTSWTHKANIAALTHYADVMSYNYATGWPTGILNDTIIFT